MRTVGIVTVARSDYGIYLPILRRIRTDSELRLYMLVAGMHLSPEFGLTANTIETDGFEIGERIEMLLSSDTPEGIAKSIGLGVLGFAQAFAKCRPEIILVLGDRFEMYAAALAALPFQIPIAHIHGGELTEGAIDDALRHSMTKLSHLHFVSTEEYAKRVMQMGEEPWRVTVTGAPSLDLIRDMTFFSKEELESRFHLDLSCPPVLATYHPVTREYESTEWQMRQVLTALERSKLPIIFTSPNSDTSSRAIVRLIHEFIQTHSRSAFVANLGAQGYFNLMRHSAVMVGNSSSGIIEALSFGLPVVNIGSRQRGRVRSANVVDVGYDAAEIVEAMERALSSEFRASFAGRPNPYGDGHASERIVRVLRETDLGKELLMKRFYDLPTEVQEPATVWRSKWLKRW